MGLMGLIGLIGLMGHIGHIGHIGLMGLMGGWKMPRAVSGDAARGVGKCGTRRWPMPHRGSAEPPRGIFVSPL